MSGIRITHKELRSCTYAVTTLRPYPDPYHCFTCQVIHKRKTYHLNLDAQGACIVSETVANALKPFMASAGLEQVNVVNEPPTLIIGGTPQTLRILTKDPTSDEYRDIGEIYG